MRLDVPVRVRRGVSMSGLLGLSAVDCASDPTSPDCVGGVYVGYDAARWAAAAAKAVVPGATLTPQEQRMASQVLNLPPPVAYQTPINPYVTPPPPVQAGYLQTVPLGMQSPVTVPNIQTYLDQYAQAAMSPFISPNVHSGQQSVSDLLATIQTAGATYLDLYPDAAKTQDIAGAVAAASKTISDYYGSQPSNYYQPNVLIPSTSPVTSPSVNLVSGGGSGTQGGGGNVLSVQTAGGKGGSPTGPNPFLPQNPTPKTSPSTSGAQGAGPDLTGRSCPTGYEWGGVTHSDCVPVKTPATTGGIDFTDPKTLMVIGAIGLGVVLMMTTGKGR